MPILTETLNLAARTRAAGMTEKHADAMITGDLYAAPTTGGAETQTGGIFDTSRPRYWRNAPPPQQISCQPPKGVFTEPSEHTSGQSGHRPGRQNHNDGTHMTPAAYNLIQELKLPKYAADVAALNIGAWINLLETQNNAVETFYANRLKEDAEKTHIVMGEARIETDTAYHKIIKRVEALMEVEGEAGYEQFANMINTVVAKFAVKRHHHNNNTDGQTGGTAGEEGAA